MIKRLLVNTPIGHLLFVARDKCTIARAALLKPESVGMIANDQIAVELIIQMCRPGKVFVDVGAHIGSVIARVQHKDRTIDIVAVEAIPEKVAHLRRAFRNVTFHECALGDSEGEASFFVNTKQSGYSSLIQPQDASGEAIQEISVPLKKLDDLLPSDGVDAIKIDVEGAELRVLRGSESILSASRPTIMFESGPMGDDRLEYTKEALWQYVSERGYLILVPNRVAHNDDGLSQEGFLESHLYPRRTTNYFAIPKERRVEIRDCARRILAIRVP